MQTIIKTFEKSKREAGAIIDEKHDIAENPRI